MSLLEVDKKKKMHTDDADARVLKTEGPLCEKDEQAQAIERLKKLQEEALNKWHFRRQQKEKSK